MVRKFQGAKTWNFRSRERIVLGAKSPVPSHRAACGWSQVALTVALCGPVPFAVTHSVFCCPNPIRTRFLTGFWYLLLRPTVVLHIASDLLDTN